MDIVKTLKNMTIEERKAYVKEYLKRLKDAKNKCGGDKNKIEAFGKKLVGKEEEIVFILLLTMVKDEYLDDILELYELLEGMFMGLMLKKGMSLANVFGVKLPFRK